jgi:hypothetical protein
VTLADVRGFSAESCSPGAFNASLSVTLPTGVRVAGTLPPALQPLTDRAAPGAVNCIIVSCVPDNSQCFDSNVCDLGCYCDSDYWCKCT